MQMNYSITEVQEFEGISESLQYVIDDAIIRQFYLTRGYHYINRYQDHQNYVCGIFLPELDILYLKYRLPFRPSTVGHIFYNLLRRSVT